MIAATNVTIRVDRTTFIASSHSYMLAMTKNHLPKIASSSDHNFSVDANYSKSLGSKSGSAAKTQQQQQQQTREYKCTPQVPPHQVMVKQ
jgi:hypothetical protein